MKPYLSIVATTRNDNHGGDLDRRTQIFIDSLAQQMEKHKISSELIIVEWNPPKGRPPMADAFQWPKKHPFLSVRIITVPAEIHANYKHSDKLPLFQMIAKNAGVRRAQGEFILETNIDIILSEELCNFIAQGKLQKNTMYRSDRVDVDRDVPKDKDLKSKLEYCESNVLRVNKKDGIYSFPPRNRARTYENATFLLVEETPEDLSASSAFANAKNLKSSIRKTLLKSFNSADRITEGVPGALANATSPLRIAAKAAVTASTLALKIAYRTIRTTSLSQTIEKAWIEWQYRRALGFKPSFESILGDVFHSSFGIPQLHTNACGDFMLMDSQSWHEIMGSPELETYSMHIDSLTMIRAFAAGKAFVDLPYPLVHYHIEHGSGWTPEGSKSLYRSFNSKGVSILGYADYLRLAHLEIVQKGEASNPSTWGLKNQKLPEAHF